MGIQTKGECADRIGTTRVILDDVFGIKDASMNKILKNQRAYRRMSLPRDYEQNVDLTKLDVDEMDKNLVEHMIEYLNKDKTENLIVGTNELKQLINERRESKRKLKVPWAYQFES